MEQLGDYTILKKLKQGAFGDVYLAEHRFIKKNFALKILPPSLSQDATFFRRFESEVAKIASLKHPNIAAIHNISCAEDHFFIVTDPYVDSLQEIITLRRYLERKGKGLLEEDYIALLAQVAQSLDYAHEQGLFHGSLNPDNILISLADEGVRLLLADFGLYHLIGERIGFSLIVKKIAEGFPNEEFHIPYSFLAPEQKKEGGQVGEKADLFAFGVLAYYLLSRNMPEGCFELPSSFLPESTNNWDVLIQHLLQRKQDLRPESAQKALEDLLYSPIPEGEKKLSLLEIEPKVDNIHQLAFELEEAPKHLSEEGPLKPVLKPGEIARPQYEPDPGAIFQRELQVSHYTPKQAEIQEVEPILTEMVIVPEGSYMRGSHEGARDEAPRHAVKLLSFAIDIHPVTNEQFICFLQVMGGEKDRNNNDIIRLRDSRIKRSGGKIIIESGYAKHPVVGVTWYGAIAYAKWVGKRLPTEAEWEAVATAGKEVLYPTGAEIERSQANFFSADTTAVMSYPPNSLGVYDLAGNVYEWCQDWYAYNYYDASALEPDQPLGPPQGVYRVLRGGCWKSLKEDMRCSHRHRNNPGAVNGTYGFRCAADAN